MTIVHTMFLNSDDFEVENKVFPCDSMETAKALADRIYKEAIDKNYDFEDEEDKKEWEKYNVRKTDNRIYINGSNAGHAIIQIIDADELTMNNVETVNIGRCYFY